MTLDVDQTRIAALVKEKRRRENILAQLFKASFDKQRDFVMDRSPRKAAQCTRRAGKSMALAMSFFEADVRHPGTNFLYVGVSLDTAVRIIWKDCLQEWSKKLKLKLIKNDGRGEITFPSGSKLYLLGIDASEDDKKKALGAKYSLVCIDEAATYKVNLKEFVEDIIEPAITDFEDGQVIMAGMPSNNTYSYFYDITTGAVPGWSVHKWSALDNPYISDNFKARIEYLKIHNPEIIHTPGYKQMYLGEWAVDDDKLVYKFKDERNTYTDLPASRHTWHYVLGIDLGWEDATAFVVNCYRDYDPHTYVVHAYKRSGMQLSEVSDYIVHLNNRYKMDRMIIDNASKQAVEDIKQRTALPLEPAEKSGKADFIGILNNDMILGNIKLQVEGAKDLITEMKALTWDQKALNKGKRQEDGKAHNHLCDAFLYAWRYCFSWVDRGVEPDPMDLEKRIEEAVEEQVLLDSHTNEEYELYGYPDETDMYY
jgi:hypothetical protein